MLQMAVDVAPESLVLWPTARIYNRGAGLGHAGLAGVLTLENQARTVLCATCLKA